MSCLRSAARSGCAWIIGLSLVSMTSSCRSPDTIESPDYEDDFGATVEYDEPITEETVGSSSMLHRRAQAEIAGGIALPMESDFGSGPAATGKFAIEIQKNLYMGLTLGWQNFSAGGSGTLGARSGAEFYESLDRYIIMGHFDYDLVLNDALLDDPKREYGDLVARFGLAAGLAIIVGDEDTSDVADFDIDPLYSLVLRPGTELRWQIWEHGSVFAGVSYDWVAENRIDIDIAGESREVDDDINFDSINAMVGFSFVW